MNGNAKNDGHKDDDQAAADGGPPPKAVEVGYAHGKHKIGRPKHNDPIRQGHTICPVQIMCALHQDRTALHPWIREERWFVKKHRSSSASDL